MKLREDVPLEGARAVPPAPQDVLKQLELVLASGFFAQSNRCRLLLSTIVNESLAGRTDALKEIVLAKEVLGRADYDPRRDTLVRVEVNAIRRKLGEYYSKAGPQDRIRIEIPTGHYVAVFSPLPAAPPEPRRHRPPISLAILGALAILSMLAAWWAARRSPGQPPGVPVQITFDTGWTSLPALSRDGSVFVFTSDRGPRGDADIWIQQAGTAPRQLTTDPALDTTPDISPDGKEVVFRSTRKGDGLWLLAANAQQDNAKLLARGYAPRFSPDGKWISFNAVGPDGTGHIFIVPHDGGLPKRVDYGTTESAFPVWSPDGSEIVFVARSANGGKWDLWRAKANAPAGQMSRPLGIQAKLSARNLPGTSSAADCPQDWIDNRLLFITHQHETSFLFEISLEPSGRLGQIRPVPSAFGAEGARAIRDSRGHMAILFAMERRQTNIWGTDLSGSLPLEQLTHDSSLKRGFQGTWPALSSDGNTLAFITERSGSPDICLKDLRSGNEQLLAVAPAVESPLFLDHNGGHVVFVRKESTATSVILRNVAGKTERVLTTDCPILHDWSRDGELLLCADGNNLFQLHISQPGRATPSLHLSTSPAVARFSPDGRWISFVADTGQGETAAGFIAPLDGSSKKTPIFQEVYGLSLHWVPNGNAIYYWSTWDGFRCLYIQPLNPQTKVPQGERVPVLHRHQLQRYPMAGGTLATASGRIAMTLSDQLANIWKVDLPR
jgi:Tol biopolymer transport system component